MSNAPTLVWFRTDLRVSDNPALLSAVRRGEPLLCLYILDEGGERRAPGGAARWWLHHSLAALATDLRRIGAELHLLRGDPRRILPGVVAQNGIRHVAWNRRYGGAERALDAALKAELTAGGIAVTSFNSHLLREPWEVQTGGGQPYKVFTPYWRAARAIGPFAPPLPAPERLPPALVLEGAERVRLDGLDLLPRRSDWAGGLRQTWMPGEAAAQAALHAFLDGPIAGYGARRDVPAEPATSRLSPHLAFGEIGPRQIVQAIAFVQARDDGRVPPQDADKFLSELGWREFAYHTLFHQPDMVDRPLNARFSSFPWHHDAGALRAWQRGMTGYPLVDAGMRELWQTGTMHNRVRMIAASFLIKHLGIDWRQGERWFWDTLCDADAASNPFNWQWVAGCGADAAPYYRIFNPVVQGARFDANGDYIRRFVPELCALPAPHIHAPWSAPAPVLAGAGIRLGESYPRPIVDHAAARLRALADYKGSGPEA